MDARVLLLAAIAMTGCVSQTSSGLVSGTVGAAAPLMELPEVEQDDVLIKHSAYVISYDAQSCIPEWVAYELTAEEVAGDLQRGGRMFSMDPDLKKVRQAMREDYRDSGWTKGHMAPAGDFRWDSTAMDETFYLTNVCPQNETLNKKDWQFLEKKVRQWAQDYGKAWVVTGPLIGENKYGTIGENEVVVPDAFFKAVMINRKGKYYSIAFVLQNDSSHQYLQDCALTVNELEEETGLNFFYNLDDSYEEKVEDQLRLQDWGLNY